jgi:Zn-dependent protease with chaperone function
VSRLVLLASLTLGVLAVVHLAGTLLSACWPVRGRRSAEARARLALALRLGPFLVASVVASVVALAFARNEPAGTQEHASSILLAAAAVGAWLLITGAWRAARSLVLTRRLVREWLAGAEPLALPGAPVPARRIESRFPVVAVAGVAFPRLFLARSVLERISAAELRAVLEHERAHLDRRDNLKRWLVHSCPDLPLLDGPGRRLRREWEEASEVAADDVAARGGPDAAEALASALVKVARMSPTGAQLSASATALLSEGSLRGRVERLLEPRREARRSRRPRPPLWAMAVLALCAGAAIPLPLRAIHAVLEAIVQALS